MYSFGKCQHTTFTNARKRLRKLPETYSHSISAMRFQSKDKDAYRTIKKFKEWAQLTQFFLINGEKMPASSSFVLTSLIQRLCCIHRNEMISAVNYSKGCIENHHYLYIALRLCYELDLKFKTKVSMLLREIFLCEGSLQAIFSILPGHLNCKMEVNINTFTLYPGDSNFDRSAFEYFINSICPLSKDSRETKNCEFTPENIMNAPFGEYQANTPLMTAIMLSDPQLVLLLLRHGADPFLCHRDDGNEYHRKSPVEYVIASLNIYSLLKDSQWARLQETKKGNDDGERKSLNYLSLFKRAVLSLDIRQTSGKVSFPNEQRDVSTKGSFFEVHPRLAEILDVQALHTPPSLLHTCRYCIRKTLLRARSDSLPSAIQKLPIPRLVKSYVDLES